MANSDISFDISDFFEKTPDWVCIAGNDGFFRQINRAVIDALEYSPEETYSLPIETFMHPDDRAHTLAMRKELMDGKALVNFENRYVSKTGKVIWLEWTSIYFADHEVVFAIAKDVTERKKREHIIKEEMLEKFRSTATYFKSNIEHERKNLASELHEELAQLASVAKMDTDWIMLQQDLPEAVRKRAEHASVVSDLLISSIKRISFAISPGLLEQNGLVDTLEGYCREFSALTGIKCRVIANCDETILTMEAKTDFFRICQEALNNTWNHSGASELTIQLQDTGTAIELSITDNGCGFNVADKEYQRGFTAMRKRLASINASLEIVSETGRGTCILVNMSKRV